jgi:cyclase
MQLPEQHTFDIADGLFAIVQGRGETGVSNSAVILDSDEALIVDTMLLPAMTEPIWALVRGRRATTILNTHHHIDHLGGNAAFPEARVLAHAATVAEARDMVDERPPFERLLPVWGVHVATDRLRLPNAMRNGDLTLPRDATLLELGPAHSPKDLALWLADSRILLAGDLCSNGVTPFAINGDVEGWVGAIDQLLALEPELVVPGHGPLATAAELRTVRDYLVRVRDAANAAVEAGATAEEALRTLDPGPVGDWLEPGRTALNLRKAMATAAGMELARPW